MVRWVRSPGLGCVRLHDERSEPRLAPWIPAFHVDELRTLDGASLDEWQAICLVKNVFTGSSVVERADLVARRARYERLWGRSSWRRASTPPPVPDPTEDES